MKLKACLHNVQTKLFLVLATAIFLLGAGLHAFADSPHLLMGNPSQATTDLANKNNFLMEKPYFALSYNDSMETPNWVSWHLTKSDLGSAPRVPFYPDDTLPVGFTRVTPKDYTGGGFDRGHMCPHSDRGANTDMSHATFVMSNIIPQAPNVNEKAWAQLEAYCRYLVEHENKTLYIVCGPAGKGGIGRNGRKASIGKQNKVVVPSKCWKVIMVLDAGPGDDLQKVNENTRLIAVIMPNNKTVGEDWTDYRTSVQDVEKLTGYKFFDKAPSSTMASLKEEVDQERIPSLNKTSD